MTPRIKKFTIQEIKTRNEDSIILEIKEIISKLSYSLATKQEKEREIEYIIKNSLFPNADTNNEYCVRLCETINKFLFELLDEWWEEKQPKVEAWKDPLSLLNDLKPDFEEEPTPQTLIINLEQKGDYIPLNTAEQELQQKIKNREFLFGGVYFKVKDMKKWWEEQGSYQNAIKNYPNLFFFLEAIHDSSLSWEQENELMQRINKNLKLTKAVDGERIINNERLQEVEKMLSEKDKKSENEKNIKLLKEQVPNLFNSDGTLRPSEVQKLKKITTFFEEFRINGLESEEKIKNYGAVLYELKKEVEAKLGNIDIFAEKHNQSRTDTEKAKNWRTQLASLGNSEPRSENAEWKNALTELSLLNEDNSINPVALEFWQKLYLNQEFLASEWPNLFDEKDQVVRDEIYRFKSFVNSANNKLSAKNIEIWDLKSENRILKSQNELLEEVMNNLGHSETGAGVSSLFERMRLLEKENKNLRSELEDLTENAESKVEFEKWYIAIFGEGVSLEVSEKQLKDLVVKNQRDSRELNNIHNLIKAKLSSNPFSPLTTLPTDWINQLVRKNDLDNQINQNIILNTFINNVEQEIRVAIDLPAGTIPNDWHQTTRVNYDKLRNIINGSPTGTLPNNWENQEIIHNHTCSAPTTSCPNPTHHTNYNNLQSESSEYQRIKTKLNGEISDTELQTLLNGFNCSHSDYDTIKQELATALAELEIQKETHVTEKQTAILDQKQAIINKIISELNLTTDKNRENVLELVISEIKSKIKDPDIPVPRQNVSLSLSELKSELEKLPLDEKEKLINNYQKPSREMIEKIKEFNQKLNILSEKEIETFQNYEQVINAQQQAVSKKIDQETSQKKTAQNWNWILGSLSVGTLIVLAIAIIRLLKNKSLSSKKNKITT